MRLLNYGAKYRLFQLCNDEMKQLPLVPRGEDMFSNCIHYM